jgi:hypothetical protein
MAEISSTDAALIGFRLTRQHPMAVIVWAIVSAVASILMVAALTILAGPVLAEMRTMSPGDSNPNVALASLGVMARAYLVIIPISLIFGGVIYAGANRLVMRPDDRGLGGLKFGVDEIRQIGGVLLTAIILFGVYIAVVVVVALIAGIAAVAGKALGFIIALLGGVAGLCLIIYVATRLSMVSPIAFATGRISVGASWRMTEGRVLPLLGAYLLAAVMAMIVAVLAMCVFLGVAGLAFGWTEASSVIFAPDTSSLATVFTPLAIIYYLFGGLVNALNGLIFLTPAPAIYQQLNGSADVFD